MGGALIFAALAVLSGNDVARVTFVLAAAVLGAGAMWICLLVHRADRAGNAAISAATRMTKHDPLPMVLTGPNRVIAYANEAAVNSFDAGEETTLAGALSRVLANAAPVLYQMESEAQARDRARRDIATAEGTVRLSVYSVGEDHYLWRCELVPKEAAPPGIGQTFPLLSLGEDDSVLAISPAAHDLLGKHPERIDTICSRPPLRPGRENDIRTASGVLSCLVVEAQRAGGGRDLMLFPGLAAGTDAPDGWAFFDALPVPLLKLARDGTIRLTNHHVRDLLGIESGEGRRLGDLMEGPGRPVQEWLDDAVAGRGTIQAETVRVRRGDTEQFVQIALNPASDNGETVLIAVLQDATQFKSLEAQFAQSQKMQAIGQLAGGVAHDFNNLLTAISGHCDLLLLRHDLGDADYGDLMQISQNANRAAALVGQLLAYSRKQTLRSRIMDLRAMLSDLTHLLNRLVGETVRLTVKHEPALWMVRADKRQLEQVLMNLVVNARDAMPEGGEIRITTENMTLDAPFRRDRAVVAPGRYAVVRVSDVGVGIPSDKLDKIFEPFYTTKSSGKGTGLGLSTAYGIIKQTGGFIFADSTPGEGTEFTLMLPAHDGPEPVERENDAPEPEMRKKGVVLLVEDEAPVRAFASRALQMRGLTVLEAKTAEEALELLEDETVTVDVFVTDVIMPGLDGPSWVRRALDARPDSRVIFVSGYAPETFSDIQNDIPDAVFLPKPFSLSDLTETVQKQLGSATD